MKTTEDRAVAAGPSVDVARWRSILDAAVARVAGRFVRAEPSRSMAAFVERLLSVVERKTCWSLAERAGRADPQAMQRLLRTAVWDADAVREDVRAWLIEQLGHPDGVLIADETGFLKKGACSVGGSGSTPAPPAGSRMLRSAAEFGLPFVFSREARRGKGLSGYDRK